MRFYYATLRLFFALGIVWSTAYLANPDENPYWLLLIGSVAIGLGVWGWEKE